MGGEEQLFQRFGRDAVAGEILFHEGDPGDEMYVIQSGAVQISKRGRVEKVLTNLGPGEFFGEMAIISSRPRTATATVLEKARLLVIDGRTFEAMIRGNSEIAVRLIKKFAERLAEADAQIENLLLRDASSRVVHYLAHAASSQGRQTPEGVRVQLSASSLAALLGLQPEPVAEILSKMASARICIPVPGGFVIPEVARLTEYLGLLQVQDKYRDLA